MEYETGTLGEQIAAGTAVETNKASVDMAEGRQALVESRCGILCSECGYREQMNCGGCVRIEKPFWGDSCPVKSCCEVKGHEHCGQCQEFPCDLLKQFAYDEEQGDGGKRIEQCRCWRNGSAS